MKKIIPITGLLFVFCVNSAQSSLAEDISARNPYPLDQTPKLKTNTTNDEYRLDSILSYRWDEEANVWEPGCFQGEVGGHFYAKKTLYAYNENGDLTKCTEIEYSEYKGGYYTYQTDEYSYDEHDKLTMMINYGYDENYDMIRRMKAQYFYNENGHLTEALHYDWDVISQEWLSSTVYLNHRFYSARTIFVYDENGNIILEKRFESDTIIKDWVMSMKSEYTYDDYDRLINAVNYSWDTTSNDWIIARGGNRNSHVHDIIHGIEWWSESFGKSTFTYDENGNLAMRIGYYFDTKDGVWVNGGRCESTYDDSINLISEQRYYWDPSNNVWIKWSLDEYTFDDNGNPVSRVWRRWDEESKDWYKKDKLEYYYSSIDQTTDNADLERYASICEVYPNPTSGALTIEVHESLILSIDLFSMSGQLLFSSQMSDSTHQLDLSPFQPGTYFITIRSKNLLTTRKVIKL